MKFAVVEYFSKSGRIWHHSDEKPNYLCDPHREIDPTSFGCYVSALKGDHIPLTYVIGTDSLFKRLVRKITGSWPQGYDISMFEEYDVLMVVYEVANGPTLTKFINKVKQKYPKIKILGVPTQPYGLLKKQWEDQPSILKELKDFINAGDIFVTIVKSTLDEWGELSDVPVRYLPQPYPVEYASRFRKDLEEKKNIIFVAGVTERPNIKKGLEVAKLVQEEMPDYIIHVTGVEGSEADYSLLDGADFMETGFMPWADHLRYLSEVKIVINTDYTQTRGRVQMDCGVVGTPSVGADSDAQIDLFGQFASDEESTVHDVKEKVLSLLKDDEEYMKVNAYAKNKLGEYSYEKAVQRLNSLFNV